MKFSFLYRCGCGRERYSEEYCGPHWPCDRCKGIQKCVTRTGSDDAVSEAEQESNPWRYNPSKTLRDEFAAAALTGLVIVRGNRYWIADELASDTSEEAYHIADAMLAEREKDAKQG